jgi:outer membrane protein OmpA-like peptidoglycan-associated protein
MRNLAGPVLALALLTGGCAKRPVLAPVAAPAPTRGELYVLLLPDQDGKTGTLTITQEGQERVLSSPYAVARITEPGKLEIETATATPEEVQHAFAPALAAQPPRPASFTLYFVEDTDEFMPESEQAVPEVVAEIAHRPAPEITVIGHTDRVGSDAHNDALSLRRAERVQAELLRVGITADRIEVAGRGEREPVVPTEDEVPEPRNRRVEISVR